MQVFLIKSKTKYSFFKYLFKRIEVKEDIIQLNCNIDKMKLKKKIKIVNKIVKFLQKNESNTVILSKNLKQKCEFLDLLYSNQINIITGRVLFKELLIEILEKIIVKNNIKKEEAEIALTVNDRSEWLNFLIIKLAKEFKTLKVITNDIVYYKKLEEELFEKDGIILTATNNKKKALNKANIIINIDFPEDTINKYIVYNESIIINLEEKIRIKKKRFCGKIINDFNISLKPKSSIFKELIKEKYAEFDVIDLAECFIKSNPQDIKNIIIC